MDYIFRKMFRKYYMELLLIWLIVYEKNVVMHDMDNQVQFLSLIWSILLSDDGFDSLIYIIYHVLVVLEKCSWKILKIITLLN